MAQSPRLFGDQEGKVMPWLDRLEGITYKSDPLMFFVNLSRYKFSGRHLRKTDRVLDAGCGTGVGSVMLAYFAGRVVGADYDEELVAQCQQQYAELTNLEFRQANLLEGPPEPEAFDAVICLDVVEHFERPDAEAVVRNLAASLKPGGLAIIGPPNNISKPYASARRKASHPYEYDPQTFDELLACGFTRRSRYAMTDEVVSTCFTKLAWYLMAVCWK